MLKHKKMTSKAGITIPKDLREETGIDSGMAVDIESSNGQIIIRKHVPVCRFCGDIQQVHTIMTIDICRSCAKKMLEEVEKKYGA